MSRLGMSPRGTLSPRNSGMQTPVSKVGGEAAETAEDKKGAVLIGDTVALWDEVRKFRLPLDGFMPIFLPSQKDCQQERGACGWRLCWTPFQISVCPSLTPICAGGRGHIDGRWRAAWKYTGEHSPPIMALAYSANPSLWE